MSHHNPHFAHASHILNHHGFSHSLGGPKIRVFATIEKIFASPSNHHGANHQHLIINVITVEHAEGMPDGLTVDNRLFVAIRFGDNEGLNQAIDFTENTNVRMEGEYINEANAYVTEDNGANGEPKLAVLHFTHHPVGFIEYPVRDQNSHGPVYS